MSEVLSTFPRTWSDIPDQGGRRLVYRCDLTWLTARWHCIYSHGCPGVDRVHQGCCSKGVFWSGPADRERVGRATERLTPQLWQYCETGRSEGIEVTASGDPGHTRIVDGACIFLNRENFPTGPGCALHFLAQAEGRSPVETKPDVCWQIPLRVTYHWDRPARTVLVSITEYTRTDWGPAGAFMKWWCSSNTLTHTAACPVYLTCATELRAIMGDTNYNALARICAERLQAPALPNPHPAGPAVTATGAGIQPDPASRQSGHDGA